MTRLVRSIPVAFALASLGVSAAQAQQPVDSTNRELASLVKQDQSEARALATARTTEEEWRRWVAAGAPRRELVRQLIRSGGLVTAEDYANGALLLQHGETPEDFMLSHVLGTIAGFKGDRNGRFLSAVSLDRYLLNVGQPQVFGSQAMPDFARMASSPWSMTPNMAIISDQIRKEFAYPLTAAQIEQHNQAHNDSLARAGTPANAPAATCALQGTWRLESVRFVESAADSGRAIPVEGVQLKVINATHFAYIRQLGDSQTVDMNGRKAAVAGSHVTGGAGTYTLKGTNYTERPEIAEPRSFVGNVIRASCRVDGDRWVHSFDIPNGRGGFREVYRRVAP